MGILYIVATPIGNIQDISLHALKVLHEVDVIACEDTRRTGTFLKILEETVYPNVSNGFHKKDQRQKLLSYFEGNELRRIPEIISYLLNDVDVAVISDAGTPAISDPGFKLIRECVREGIRVVPIPGPSSFLSALVVSGLPTDKFLFLGYPPRKPGHRIKLYESIKESQKYIKATIILFEAPHKVLKTLEELHTVFGEIDIVICRELTKIHEEVRREKISASRIHFQKTSPKGEFVLLLQI